MKLLESFLGLVGTALVVFCTLNLIKPVRGGDGIFLYSLASLSRDVMVMELGATAGVVLIVLAVLLYRRKPN